MNIVERFTELLDEIIKNTPQRPKYHEVIGTLRFTPKECKQMGTDIQERMNNEWDRCIRVKKSYTDKGIIYTLCIRRDGYRIEVQDKSLLHAKKRFIRATHRKRKSVAVQLSMAA